MVRIMTKNDNNKIIEWIMTWSWAILALVVVVGVVYNIMLDDNDKITAPEYLQLKADEWSEVCVNSTTVDMYELIEPPIECMYDGSECYSACYAACEMISVCNFNVNKYTCNIEGDMHCYNACIGNTTSFFIFKQRNETVCTEWILVRR